MGTKTDEWIGVADVADELHLTQRHAWELVKKLGVPCVGPVRDVMRLARFSRADWETARDRSKAPPTPRHSKQARGRPVATKLGAAVSRIEGAGDRLSAWRKKASR
jgi:hypothetical protein